MRHIIVLFLLSVWIVPVFAQRVKEPGFTDVKVMREGDSLVVSMRLILGKKLNRRDYKQIITPVLYKDAFREEFSKVIVRTRRSRILDERHQLSYGIQTEPEGAYYEIGCDQVIEYSCATLYQDWMQDANLCLERVMSGCCSEENLSPVNLAVSMPSVPKVDLTSVLLEQLPEMIVLQVPADPAIKPVSRKWEFTKEDMIIDFKVNEINIDFALFNNKEALAEIVKALQQIKNTEGAKLDRIEIVGYASPEGKMEYNKQLAGDRAAALEKYLLEQLPYLRMSSFKLKNGGENWSGLRKMVAESDMPYKKEVLYIIDNVPEEINYVKNTSRKKQLMDLASGVPFNYMRKVFFEKLRNACYISVYYDIANDTIADTINGAIPFIRSHNFGKALEMLLPVKDDSRSWNLIGVCYLLTGKYEEAREYLQKAVDYGDELAQKNILLVP